MSRVGKAPIEIPSGVDVTVRGRDVSVKGPKGSLERTFSDRVRISVKDGVATVERFDDQRESRALHGLSRALLANMVKHADLPWDCIFSAELFHHYKPDPETYLGAARLLALRPYEVMMVAAHPDDLVAARGNGLRTAYVHRPREFGGRGERPLPQEPFDHIARDFVDLAEQLGA